MNAAENRRRLALARANAIENRTGSSEQDRWAKMIRNSDDIRYAEKVGGASQAVGKNVMESKTYMTRKRDL